MGSADFRLIRPVGVTADGAFSRASPKWVFDQSGALVQVPNNTLAVTSDLADLTKAPYALVEDAAVKCLPQNDALASWSTYTTSAATVSVQAIADPQFGTVFRITKTGGAPGDRAGIKAGTVTGLTGSTYSVGCYVRRGTATTTGFAPYVDANATPGTLMPCSAPFNAVQTVGSWAHITNTISDPTRTLTGTGTAYIWVDSNVGDYVDVKLPEVELGGSVSSPVVVGAGAAPYTRAADVIGSDTGLVYSNVPITEPSYSSTATYVKDALVYDANSRLVYQSLIDANTGKALTDTTAWTPQLGTNRWRMFDKAVNSQTSAPDLLVVAVKPGQLVNTIGLLNVSGSSVTVSQTDSYYVQSKSLVRHDVLNWYDFFYEEPIREGDVMFDGVPPYVNSTLVITVANPGDTASIGCCVLGKSRTIGKTLWDLTGGILSYSSSTTDKFGNVTLVKRDNSKVLNFEVYIPSGFESEAYRLLREYTDVEIMIVGAEDYSMTYSYGYLGQWTVPVTNSAKTAHIEFKGLV